MNNPIPQYGKCGCSKPCGEHKAKLDMKNRAPTDTKHYKRKKTEKVYDSRERRFY